MSDYDRIAVLLARSIAGELIPEEAEELRLILEQDPVLQQLASAIEAVSDAPPKDITSKEEQMMLERGLRQWKQRTSGIHVFAAATADPSSYPGNGSHRDTIEHQDTRPADEAYSARRYPEKSPGRKLFRWSAAAAVIATLALGFYLFRSPNPQPEAAVLWREVSAKYGTRNYLELPDGSKIWLNAGSRIRYADAFSNGKRSLQLQGEAYFDIKHDPRQPFLIDLGKVVVKVLGTSLNVRAYPGDSIIETTLIQGKAEIEVPGRNSSSIMLRPSEKVTLYNNRYKEDHLPPDSGRNKPVVDNTANAAPDFQRRNVTADPAYKTIIETSWVEDKLIFRKEPFQEVAAKLERWYNIRIHFENHKYQNEELTGYFKDQPIKNVIDALQLSLGFHYEIAGDSILIR